MGENRWHLVVTVLVIAALIAIFFSGYIFATYSNSESPTGTKSSIVGCTFEYSIKGNYDDEYYYSGTEKQYIIDENSTSYNVRTNVSLYKISSKTGISEELENTETTAWVVRTAMSSPGKYDGTTALSTYWGTQNVRNYVKTDTDSETRSFIGYTLITMEKYIKTSTSLKIYILSNTDYIYDSKVNNFGTYSVTTSVYGTVTESTVQSVTGSEQTKQIDTTGTCYKKYFKETVTTGTDRKQDTYTKWVVRADDEPDYGVYTGVGTCKYKNISVECNIYTEVDGALTTVSYVYHDKILLKSTTTGTSEGKRYEVYMSTTELIMDNASVSSVEDLNKLCDMM